jgi:hypothetical protein
MQCRDAMPRVLSPIGFNINLLPTPSFESGFSGFIGLTITSSIRLGRLFGDASFISKPFADALTHRRKVGVKSISL